MFDQREVMQPPFEGLRRYLAQLSDLAFFSLSSYDFFSMIPMHFCTMGEVNFIKGYGFSATVVFQDYSVAFLALWHFQGVQECKVCMGLSLKIVDRHLHTFCIFCIFKFQNADNAGNAGEFH